LSPEEFDKETVAKVFANFAEKFMFDTLPKNLKKYVGEGAATALIFNIVKEGAKETMGEELKKMIKVESLKDAMKACYLPYKLVGMEFEYEEAEEGDEYVFKVTKCPHFKYTKDMPFACAACAAIKAGIIEKLEDKPVQIVFKGTRRLGSREPGILIEVVKHMPSGDPYCEFRLKELPRQGQS